MSKSKRGFQAPTTGGGGTTPTQDPANAAGSEPGAVPAPTSGGRAAARRRSAPVKVSPEPTSPLEKYRFLLLIGLVVVGLGAVGIVFMQSASAAPYTCTTLLTPGPVEPVPTPRPLLAAATATPSPGGSGDPTATAAPVTDPEPQPTQRLGFPAQDLGQGHVSQNESVTYAYCPPTSGEHFNVQNLAPLRREFYGPDDELRPGNWIHNLEHGYVVLLYQGDPGEEVLGQLQQIMDTAAGGSLAEACGLPNKVVVARFDDMTEPFGAVSWDRALLLPGFDQQQLLTFTEQWQDSPVTPERAC